MWEDAPSLINASSASLIFDNIQAIKNYRITSYNVCYTKLCEAEAGAGRGDRGQVRS